MDWVEERLDRALASISWIRLFPRAKVHNLEASSSDHLPIFLEPAPLVFHSRIRRFRFENAWLCELDCMEVVKDSWFSFAAMLIQSKIAKCGSDLVRWGDHLSHEFRNRIMECKRRMGLLRGKRDDGSMTQFTEARSMYNELLHNHEVYWKQRSKILWL